MQDGYGDNIFLDAQIAIRQLGEALGEALVDLPVTARFPGWIDGLRQRVDERVHIRGIQIVLLVPGGGRQHDVGIQTGGGHTEVQRHQQIQLAFRCLIMPDHILRLDVAGLPQVFALHPVGGAEQMLEEVFVALTRRTKQIRAPDKHVAREVLGVIRIVAGELQFAGFQLADDIVLGIDALGDGLA